MQRNLNVSTLERASRLPRAGFRGAATKLFVTMAENDLICSGSCTGIEGRRAYRQMENQTERSAANLGAKSQRVMRRQRTRRFRPREPYYVMKDASGQSRWP